MMSACRWINAIHGSTDGKGSGQVQMDGATPRSGRLSKLMQSDLEDSSAPRTEIVTVDTLTNKVNGLRCWSCLELVLVLLPSLPRILSQPLYSPSAPGAREAGSRSAKAAKWSGLALASQVSIGLFVP